MSGNEQRNVNYDPLPLTNDDHPSNVLYNAPPSPDPHISAFHTPIMNPSELGGDMPLGAATPRFLGAALYDDPGAPRIRDSYASSHNTMPSGGNGSEYTGSVYALNDTLGAQPLTHGPYSGAYHDDPRDGFPGEQGGHPMSPMGQNRLMEEKRAAYAPPRAKSKRMVIILAIIASLILLILAVIIPIYFFVVRPNSQKSAADEAQESAANPTSTTGSKPPVVAAVSGGDGSKVTMEDGTTFTYSNPFGGIWYWDENDPFNNGAKAQSWSPALNETFNYGVDKIRG